MGDTAAIKAACANQVANPSASKFIELIQCGVTLADVNDVANSTKLFEAAAAQNPYHRDALYNLARQQMVMADYEHALATTDRLVAIDPSNPDNLKLYVYAYGSMRKQYVARAAAVGDSVNKLPRTQANQAKRTAMTNEAIRLDSLQKAALNKQFDWNNKADSMTVQVLFAEFTPMADKATLGGEIRNRTDSEKSYVLNVEFLDKTGAVVGTGSATVDKVAAKSSGRFSITATAPGIAAFRYKPIR
jgi:tetratricopeptide (TPR) repeat protein